MVQLKGIRSWTQYTELELENDLYYSTLIMALLNKAFDKLELMTGTKLFFNIINICLLKS